MSPAYIQKCLETLFGVSGVTKNRCDKSIVIFCSYSLVFFITSGREKIFFQKSRKWRQNDQKIQKFEIQSQIFSAELIQSANQPGPRPDLPQSNFPLNKNFLAQK